MRCPLVLVFFWSQAAPVDGSPVVLAERPAEVRLLEGTPYVAIDASLPDLPADGTGPCSLLASRIAIENRR